MKKIINDVDVVVEEMCAGIVKAHPELCFDERYKVIKRATIDTCKVCLISGGGSGHEPAHAGYIGKGMLTAAVCGKVFASPSTVQVYNAILQTKGSAGTLLIIKNYSGDCMNFEAAAEMAEDDGILVERVYVNDDIAVQDSLYTIGRRGVAGTVFVHKLTGAAAEMGKSLKEVKRIAEKTIGNVKSIGFALTSCTVPAKGSPTISLDEDEIEFGVGIHGEPGIERCGMASASELAERMSKLLLDEMKMSSGTECAVMMNGFGGTPMMELYVMYNNLADILETQGIKIYKALVGNYMTSLDMAGASITLLRLDNELKELLDSEARTPAFSILR